MCEKVTDYSDGSETNMWEVLMSPDFDERSAWVNFEDDWPMLYHLSPLRKNVVRWLRFAAGPVDVLELGAGCGAITSHLVGMENVGNVVAVEGSPLRAELIRLRCKDASNLKVVAGNIDSFETQLRFDVILLIGVLEYADMYIRGCNPYKRMLEMASGWLKDKGSLILAMENRLGHKYLAGYPEDHYHVAFEGVSNYPHYRGIRTFDKHSLSGMLQEVGLVRRFWSYPFPDYKMPEVILTDCSFVYDGFDWLTLLDLPTRARSTGGRPLFSEREFLKALPGVSVGDFMNSFLVFAGREDTDLFPRDVLAVKIQALRARRFCHKKSFVLRSDSSVVVREETESGEQREMPYHAHTVNLLDLILDSIYHGRFAEASGHVLRWINLVRKNAVRDEDGQRRHAFDEFCKCSLGKTVYTRVGTWVPGRCLDLIPQNCLLKEQSKELIVIDQEWGVDTDVPLQLVVDRGVFITLFKLARLQHSRSFRDVRGRWVMPEYLIQIFPPGIVPELESWSYFESWLQKAVSSGDFSVCLDRKDREQLGREFLGKVPFREWAKNAVMRFAASIPIVTRFSRGVVVRAERMKEL